MHKEVRYKTMKCYICDYSTVGITSLTHHKKIHYTPEKPFDSSKCGKGFQNKFHLHQHYQTPSKNKVNVFQWFSCGKCFQEKSNLRQHIDNILQYNQRFSCPPWGQILRKKCTLSFHSDIKHPDPNMPFPEWSCEICKEP